MRDTRRRLCLIGLHTQRRFCVNFREDRSYHLSYPVQFGRKIALYAGVAMGSVSLFNLATMDENDNFAEFVIHIETNENGENTTIQREKFRSDKDLFDEVLCKTRIVCNAVAGKLCKFTAHVP